MKTKKVYHADYNYYTYYDYYTIPIGKAQLNAFSCANKKEGNITRANATTNPSNLAFQAGRQASALLPPSKGSNLSGRQAVAPLPSRGRKQFNSDRCSPSL